MLAFLLFFNRLTFITRESKDNALQLQQIALIDLALYGNGILTKIYLIARARPTHHFIIQSNLYYVLFLKREWHKSTFFFTKIPNSFFTKFIIINNFLFSCFNRLGPCELPLPDQWLSHTSASHLSQQSISPLLLSPRAANNNNNNNINTNNNNITNNNNFNISQQQVWTGYHMCPFARILMLNFQFSISDTSAATIAE